MSKYPSWKYEEIQIGKDYCDRAEVEAYDTRHGKIRNVGQENERILEDLRLKPEHTVIDLGTGTGEFALQAARRCAKVYAVDISPAMLEYAGKKADAAGITNIIFCRGGFLTYSHTAGSVDAIVTNTAFHHLPDFWKGMALKRLNGMLKVGGLLYIADIVFEDKDVEKNVERWIAFLEKIGGPGIRKDIELHISKEFSTYDWILDGLLGRANFGIESKVIEEGVIGRYLCRKESDCKEVA